LFLTHGVDVPDMGKLKLKFLRTFVCTIVAVSGAKFSSEDHRTHAKTTPSADETRSSFDTSTLPPQGRLLALRVSNCLNLDRRTLETASAVCDICTGTVVLN